MAPDPFDPYAVMALRARQRGQCCELCGREVPQLTVHHLVPRSQGRRGEELPTALICSACHRQLHVLFSNEALAREYNTLEKIRSQPDMARFLRWVCKQSGGRHIRVRKLRP